MDLNAIAEFLTATIRMSTPIILAGLAATIGERAGVLNIGLEGMMLIGACSGAVCSFFSGSALVGILGAVLIGVVVGYIFSIFTVRFHGNQAVVSVALNILSVGLTTLVSTLVWQNRGASSWLPSVGHFEIPLLSKIPFLGDVIGKLSPVIYLTLILVLVLRWALFRTWWGLRLRSVGENPLAAQTVGLNVYRTRTVALLISGALCGLAGAYLSIDQLNVFTKNMSAGRGYLAYAANIFGQWNPLGVYASGLIFGAMEAVQMRVQSIGIPSQLAQMIPYVVTILAVTFNFKKTVGPAAVGDPYVQNISKSKRKTRRRVTGGDRS